MFVYVTVFAPGCRWLEKRPESIIRWHFTQKCSGYAHHPHPVQYELLLTYHWILILNTLLFVFIDCKVNTLYS